MFDPTLPNLSLRYKLPLQASALVLITVLLLTSAILAREYQHSRQDLFNGAESTAKLLATTLVQPMVHDDLWRVYALIHAPFDPRDPWPLGAESLLVLDTEPELGLLNTFAALILPGMANGYSIFLLKGFFDSLPQELYESAEIDGAGEFCIFWQITMSLSTPILAVIALNAFNAAYGNFMMALLVCQDQNMWTLMPWLYQLQMGSGQGLIFASLVVAAVPTFLVFVFCQNIIMRGIVVPVEK